MLYCILVLVFRLSEMGLLYIYWVFTQRSDNRRYTVKFNSVISLAYVASKSPLTLLNDIRSFSISMLIAQNAQSSLDIAVLFGRPSVKIVKQTRCCNRSSKHS